MNIGLRQLRAFLSVARRGSFTRAAEDVGLSQSALSLSVRQLENELGLKLLDRTTRQVQLTTVGQTLVATGSRLVDELDATLRELRDIGEQHRGRVVMACVPAVARSLMPKCVAHCSAKWPNVSLSIDDSAASDVIRKVGRGEVEFGIASGQIASSELYVQPLMDDPFCLVCRRDDPMAKNRNVRWAELADRRLVMLSNTSGSRQVIETTLASAGTQVEVFLELAQPSSVLGMVEAGVGIAIVPELAAPRKDDTILATLRLVKPEVSRTILLLRRRDRSLSPAASAVWDALLHLYRGTGKDLNPAPDR
ncbi:LysR family transcriptional regulator [Bradyrhizobium sp. Ash2021]|uniref:LysR family transcriptional regulator n=1 Tax=Bradyrhizobium sp. Ash2021 TaxID=2954771 RepID=UPI002815A6F6|nr:LysR family transcriptional regulator [Bradyrhizobium sp. Ash2021]WMT74615.1 LysR family transcriptional regulator [Bradyrhizobium sp. Ash2021]